MSEYDKWDLYEQSKEQEALARIGRGNDLLFQNTPEAELVRNWFKKKHADQLHLDIAHILGEKVQLDSWGKLNSEERKKKAVKVAKLARQLANELQDFPKPEIPLALSLVDNMDAMAILHAIFYSDALPSSKSFEFNPVLEALADFADTAPNVRRLDARPNTGTPEARILCRQLAEAFLKNDLRPSHTIIAAAIILAFPNLDTPPNSDTVRDWLKSSGYSPSDLG